MIAQVLSGNSAIEAERRLVDAEIVVQNGNEVTKMEPVEFLKRENGTKVKHLDEIEEIEEIYNCRFYNLTGMCKIFK